MLALWLLLPVLIYFLAAGAILVLNRLRPGFGYAWLLAVVTVFANWGLILYFRFNPPPAIILINWLPVTQSIGTLIFQLDTPAWVYTFSLAGLAAAVILTAAVRLKYRSSPATWAANLAITAVGMLATLAGTPLTLALAWTLIDAVELVFMLAAVPDRSLSAQVVMAFLARVTGTLVLLGSMALSKAGGQDLLLVNAPANLSIFLVIAAGLRLGVLPLNLPYFREFVFRRGVSTTLRMVAAASSLVLLGRLPATAVPVAWFPWLLLFASLAAFYGSVKWLISTNEIAGRPYWLIALAGLAVGSVIRSHPVASLAWGMCLILSGGILFLYSARERRMIFLPALGVLVMSGLPFTPAGGGWQGLVILPINLPDFIFLLAQVLLVVGYIRHMLRPEESLAGMERWIKGVYPLGLLLLALTAWLIELLGWPNATGLDHWGASVIAAGLAAGGWFGLGRLRTWWPAHPEHTAWLSVVARPVGAVLNNLFRFDWLYRLIEIAYLILQRFIQAVTVILEGEGGVLWVLVLLALLASLLMSGGASL